MATKKKAAKKKAVKKTPKKQVKKGKGGTSSLSSELPSTRPPG